MKNIIENKKILFFCIMLILMVIFGVYFIKQTQLNNDKSDIYSEKSDYSFLKDYSVNEYIPVTVTQEEMAKIYITEFKNLMVTDPERAYSYLNDEYKKIKFGSYEKFLDYANEIQSKVFFDYDISKYSVKLINNNKIIYIKDNSEFMYIFKEKSIMQYEVYLDDNLVEIK